MHPTAVTCGGHVMVIVSATGQCVSRAGWGHLLLFSFNDTFSFFSQFLCWTFNQEHSHWSPAVFLESCGNKWPWGKETRGLSGRAVTLGRGKEISWSSSGVLIPSGSWGELKLYVVGYSYAHLSSPGQIVVIPISDTLLSFLWVVC